jgi:predicted Zn-dependent protease
LASVSLSAASQGAERRPPSAADEREFKVAIAAQDAGDIDRAESILTDLHNKHPGIFAVDESLGLIYIAREKTAEAVPLLEAATRDNPTSDVAHANLGSAYSKLQRNTDALREMQRAAQLKPGNPQTQRALGQLWMEAHKPARASEARVND